MRPRFVPGGFSASFIGDRGRDRGKNLGAKMDTLTRVVVPRVFSGLIVVWAAISLTFFAVHFAPGDIVDLLIGDQDHINEAAVRQAVTDELGLDRPLIVQYFSHLQRIATGDFGTSYLLRKPVLTVITEQSLPTLFLSLSAAVFAVTMAVIVASVTANRGPATKSVVSAAELTVISIPNFWLGILLIVVFSFWLGWLPSTGTRGFNSLILPVLTLGIPIAAVLTQVLRKGMEDALQMPYAMTVQARGAGELRLVVRHVLRHATIPAVTLTGWIIGGLLTGTFIVEQVFSRPGLGQVAVSAVQRRDVPVIMGVTMLSAIAYVVTSTIVDICYEFIDPRLRNASHKKGSDR